MQVAIDGPGGAGKSSIAKLIAAKMNMIYVDTGALYRAIGLYALRAGKNTRSEGEVTPLLPSIKVDLRFIDGVQHVFVNDEDVSDHLRTEDVSMAASDVSKHPSVRSFLLDLQRDIASKNDVIMDGRDIGTVILPDADVKIFLTADAKERARRRVEQLADKGVTADFDVVLADLNERDKQDSERATAPLKPADDGIILDTTSFTFEESVQAITEIIVSKQNKG